MDLEFIKQSPWSDAEQQIAKRFGLKVCPITERMSELNAKDIAASDFSYDSVQEAFANEHRVITEFGGRWYADCMGHDYGEEWDPEEGNQQDFDPDIKLHGLGQGFIIKYTLFYMYAKDKPEGLLDYLKRLRIPHARNVARDIMRVYKQVNAI